MCLILFAYNVHPRYKFVLAANRDEFYSRPTSPAKFWNDAPNILAGQDLVHNGTWLGITKNGRFAAVTNYRDPNAENGTKSRGDLTKDFLTDSETAENYLLKIEREKTTYSGFNLLVGEFTEDKNGFFYFSNRGDGIKNLSKGIYGLSNHLLNTNWHKVETGKRRFTEIVQNSDEIDSAELINILENRIVASDEKLPNTGIGIERERILSPAFIETKGYGTRSSTVLLIENSGKASFVEKTYIGTTGEVNYEFSIEK